MFAALKLVSRLVSSIGFILLIIVSVPLAFDVGGRDCGLAFSLALSTFYWLLSILRLAINRRRHLWPLLYLLGALQYLIVPALLIFNLDRFQTDPPPFDSTARKVRRVIGFTADEPEPVGGEDPILWDRLTIVPWNAFLTIFTPIFQLVEGFCTLLVIQSVGQIGRWLVHRKKSDTWNIALLVASGSIITSAFYFIYRIYTFPDISAIDATLIGVAVTSSLFLCGYGIASGRGSSIESSLLFSYVVLCMYQIFTDYKPNNPPEISEKPDFPPLPPFIISSVSNISESILQVLPLAITSAFIFIRSALDTIPPSVLVSLAYRLFVLNASTKIIPAVREGKSLSMEDENEDDPGSGGTTRFLTFIRSFSPVAMITVYTNLLMMHFEAMRGGELGIAVGKMGWINMLIWTPLGAEIWRWVNVLATLALYSFELCQAQADDEDGTTLTSHWKTD
ncbi:hypothetical protein TWF106_005318 [Orbilia oligospora]|uniref:Uncharacterized protein n=1 Tax=Orbilia oligospora TaxID=2813651 RepID=A0A6G1MHS1_ORBOL|nr:hypothetical protein TWF679_001711 [Orbilia oligospora]KAF3216676.1 hypothetical protein TWF191_008921 [Orbilia oligospora]KAF3222890.1 hypothetical protein TWF106_005318 [Orbilia oligospora]KAF3257206.1 hypothetical protein TWF192_001480 [Orbilia oligospora]